MNAAVDGAPTKNCDMIVMDAHCVLGRHLKMQANGPHSVEDLLANMDQFGIAEALVVAIAIQQFLAKPEKSLMGQTIIL